MFCFCLFFLMQRVLTCEPWELRGILDKFGGVLRGLEVFKLSQDQTWRVLIVEKLICKVWRWLKLKNIWIECFVCLRTYLRGLEVFIQKFMTWVFWMFSGLFVMVEFWKVCLKPFKVSELKEVLFECLECGKTYVNALNVIWNQMYVTWEIW